jgi:hypothetical protein
MPESSYMMILALTTPVDNTISDVVKEAACRFAGPRTQPICAHWDALESVAVRLAAL